MMIQFAVTFMAMFESCEMLLHNSFLCLVMGRDGSPISSPEEGAWTREGLKVVE